MENLKKALERFCASHKDFLEANSGYSTGYGLDPARKGPVGLLVFAMDNDVRVQDDLLRKARTDLPSSWEGFPVYLTGRSIPIAPRPLPKR